MSAESTELQTCKSSLKVAIPASNQPDYHLSTKTKMTTDLRSSSALVPVTPHSRSILRFPIHIVHGINTSYPRNTRRG